MRKAIGGACLAVLGLAACAAEEGAGVAGASVPLRFEVRGAGTQGLSSSSAGLSGLVITDEAGGTYTLATTLVNLRDIELDLPAGTTCADVEAELAGGARCDSAADDAGGGGEAKVRIDGPFLVDLIAGTATPDLSGVRVPDLGYQRIDFRVEPADGGPLGEASWETTATFGDASTLTLRLEFNEDFRVEAPGGVTTGSGNALLVRFDAAAWLSGVGLGACVASGDAGEGDATIDDGSGGACSGVEGALKEALKRSASLHRDGGADDGPGHD